MGFSKDDRARVPFSAIGVLLLSAAIATVALLVQLDARVARETAREPEISESAELLAAAKADLARLLSASVEGAAADVAAAPVVAGFQGPLPGGVTPEECAKSEECVVAFNEERVRRAAHARLAGYLAPFNATYRQGESRATARPAENWTNLTLEPVSMDVARSLNPPLWGPRGDAEGHWLARLPVNFAVTKPGQRPYMNATSIETFVPGRFPFVRNLTEGFARERLQGGPVFWEFTGGSFGQVWMKGYLQWAGGNEKDIYGQKRNGDVERLLNGVLLLDEGFQFQAVDPGSLRAALPEEGRKALDAVSRTGGGLVETGKTLEELLAGDGSGKAREKMREPRSADEFLVCPLGPGADISTGDSRPACSVSPEQTEGACGLCRSDGIRDKIRDIASHVYSAEIRADISRQTGTTGPCPGASGWRYTGHSCSATSVPPGALGADACSVSYARTCTESKGEETTTYSQSRSDAVRVAFVATDYSRTNLDLSAAGLPGSGSTGSDVAGAFSQTAFNGASDPNLADALSKYRAQHWRFEDQRGVLSDPGSSGLANSWTVSTERPGWLEGAAEGEARDLLQRFKEVKTGPGTTPENQTHYADYLKNVSRELSEGVKGKAPGFAERERFADDGTYKSAAAKALYLSRAWFVDDAVRRTRDFGGAGAAAVAGNITGLLGRAGGPGDAGERSAEAVRKAGEFLKGAASFPLGMNMSLAVSNESAKERGWARGWNETVRLDVDQTPDWLNASGDGGGAGFVPLSVRTWSADSAGVTWPPTEHGGWGVLPPPLPWVVTANAWVVDVKGEFELTVEDAGEKVWNGTGFEAVKWVRENRTVFEAGNAIGTNDNVRFEFQ